MLNSIKKVAGVGITAGMVLAATANDAVAYDFAFSGFPVGTDYSAEGSFTVDNSAIPSTTLSRSDFTAWDITLKNTTTNQETSIFGEDGGSSNSVFFLRSSSGITVDSSELVFPTSSSICINTNLASSSNCNSTSSTSGIFFDGSRSAAHQNSGWNLGSFSGLTATATASPTPVPFGVSTDLSLLILGGLYGASRLRKKLAK